MSLLPKNAAYSQRYGKFQLNRCRDDYLERLYRLAGPNAPWELMTFVKNALGQKITNISVGQAQNGPYHSGYRLINMSLPHELGATATFKV